VVLVVSLVASTKDFDLRRVRLVLEWVTVFGFNSGCGKLFSICNQPDGSTQHSHPSVRGRNEYQPIGGDALQLGV